VITGGIDEAGRGPLAGPVTAAAVVLGPDVNSDLNDSKKLSAARREALSEWIKSHALAWGIGWASHEEIDELNILRASHLAMKRAIDRMWVAPERFVVDGSVVPRIGYRMVAIVKADATDPQVMAASILAKVARDRWMQAYDTLEPQYGYAGHKGYPTRDHRAVVIRLGVSRIQRLSFSYASSRQ
jgi:ribonuclease HII